MRTNKFPTYSRFPIPSEPFLTLDIDCRWVAFHSANEIIRNNKIVLQIPDHFSRSRLPRPERKKKKKTTLLSYSGEGEKDESRLSNPSYGGECRSVISINWYLFCTIDTGVSIYRWNNANIGNANLFVVLGRESCAIAITGIANTIIFVSRFNLA